MGISVNIQAGSAASQVLDKFSRDIDAETDRMKEDLIKLHNYFMDSGYDVFSTGVLAEYNNIIDACAEIIDLSKNLGDYINALSTVK